MISKQHPYIKSYILTIPIDCEYMGVSQCIPKFQHVFSKCLGYHFHIFSSCRTFVSLSIFCVMSTLD